ncbi:fimbrial biogenesis chaperone [Flavitalea antarctica]
MKTHLTHPKHWISSQVFLISIFFCVFSLALATDTFAQGNLFIAPKRVVFERRDRVKELNLSNISQDTARYEISLIHYRMKDNGSMEEIKTPDSGVAFADPFVRFFPRSVILAPGESQVVRIQLTQTDKLENGEYRSHLYLRAIPNDKDSNEPQKKKTDSTTFSIQLKALVGVAVPVLIQVGESTTHIALSQCVIERTNRPAIKMTLNRTGNMSFYGDLTIDYVSPEGNVTRVSSVKGVAVYAPNAFRSLTLPLNASPGIDYSRGKLHIVYLAPEKQNPNTIAQTEVYLN